MITKAEERFLNYLPYVVESTGHRQIPPHKGQAMQNCDISDVVGLTTWCNIIQIAR